jgi:hypothetical protein
MVIGLLAALIAVLFTRDGTGIKLSRLCPQQRAV